MKSVAFLVDSIFSFGGVQRVTAVIAKELAKDYRVTIITRDSEDKRDTSFYNLNEADIDYRFFSYPSTPKWKWFLCKSYSYLYRRWLPHTRLTSDLYAHSSFPSQKRNALISELKRGNYDVIIGVHAPLAVRLATCRKALSGSLLIGWVHNSYEALFGKESLYIGPELRNHYEWQLSKLDHTIVLCCYDASKYRFPVEVIYNPLTLKPGAPSKGTSKRFLAIGRFSHQHKGFDLLIDAFYIFAEHDSQWKLDIVGEGPEEELYRKKIIDYGLEDRIELHPFTNDVQHFYSEAQVYVLSSRWEGFGLVLVEAMAHGLPVVSSDLPTSMEIMGDFGLYFTNGNIYELAKALNYATQLDWTAKSADAIDIAKHFSIEQIIEQWKNLIDER